MRTRTKAAGAVKRRTFTLTQIVEADAAECGLCLNCGAQLDCCAPGARASRCETCKQNHVYGAGEIMAMGLCSG